MTTKKVNIFIASSAEVSEERDKCIRHLNQVNISHDHLHLKPVLWEFDLHHGSYPNFESIQDAINPLLEESSLCIFIFYSKIGKFTRQEFELTNKKGKTLFAYFKKGFSPSSIEEIKTFGELIEFKASMNETILYKNYDSVDKFGELLKDNLHVYLSKEFSEPSFDDEESLSNNVRTLMKILTQKEDKIEELKSSLSALPDKAIQEKVKSLEKEKNDLRAELNKNKEIQQQQTKVKQELEARLASQLKKDNLKEKALSAIKENNFADAEQLLKESAKDSIFEAASTYFELGKLKKLQLSYKEALRYFELAVEMSPDDFGMNMEAGISLRGLGYNDQAIERFENALSEIEKGADPDKNQLAILNSELAQAYYNKAVFDVALEHNEVALDLYKFIHGKEHPDIARRYNHVGLIYDGKGEWDKAIDFYQMALEMYLQFYDEDHAYIAYEYNNIGASYDNKGEWDKAIDYIDKALVIKKKIHNDDHPDIADSYVNMGLAYDSKKGFETAIDYYQKALDIYKKFFGEKHPKIAVVYNNIGIAKDSLEDYDSAMKYFEKALVIYNQFHGAEHPDIATGYSNIGSVYKDKGEYENAISQYEKALSIYKKFHGEAHPDIAISYGNIGSVYDDMADYEKAKINYTKSLEIYKNFLQDDHYHIATLKANIDRCNQNLGRQ